MCKYRSICPAYDSREDRCNDIEHSHKLEAIKCVPLLLEAYNAAIGTPYMDIREVLYGEQD